MSESEAKLSPENLFKYDYINEFVGMDINLQTLRSGEVDVDFFKSRCKEIAAQKNGKVVLKFTEKYNMPAPAGHETKIQEIDVLVDRINAWVEEFLKDDNGKNTDELTEMVAQVFNIMKSPKKKIK